MFHHTSTAKVDLNDVQLAVTDLLHLLEVGKSLLLDMPFERDGRRDVALDQVNSVVSVAGTMAQLIDQMIADNFQAIAGGQM